MKRFLVALSLCVFIVSCGPPTVAGAESRYKSNVDKISAIMTRKPEAKATLDAKLAEFKGDYDKALKEPDDEKKISALSSLSSRMETFINDVEPATKAAGGAAAPSDKLDKKGGPAVPPVSAPGGKLDGPGGSGMGGTPTATPTPGTPTATPTPTPTPTPGATPTMPTTQPTNAPAGSGPVGGM